MVSAMKKERTVIDAFYRNPGLILTASFFFGTVAGLLLTAGIATLSQRSELHTQRQWHLIRERAAYETLMEETIEIDEDKMLCATCWEERHPGLRWGFQRRTLCIEHLPPESVGTGEQVLKQQVNNQREESASQTTRS